MRTTATVTQSRESGIRSVMVVDSVRKAAYRLGIYNVFSPWQVPSERSRLGPRLAPPVRVQHGVRVAQLRFYVWSLAHLVIQFVLLSVVI